ncbi:MAG TPA: hypothetical protein VGL54_09820 [Solirubrobacteraceae bacterium]|jgi:hypothetical protein
MHGDFTRSAKTILRQVPILLLLPVVGFGVWVTIDPPYTNSPPIRSDGLGYYAWTNGILNWDFDFCQWQELAIVGALPSTQYPLPNRDPVHRNRCPDKYSPGMALLRFPVMAPVALLSGYGSDQTLVVSNASEQADQWLGLATLFLTAWLMWATLRRLEVGTWTAQFTVLCLVFGTGLFHYATYDSSFTHESSAALFAALIFVGVGAMRRRTPPNPWLLFGLALFIVWIREPDALPMLLLVASWIFWKTRGLEGAERLRDAARLALPVLGAIVFVVVFQFLYVRWSTHTWSLNDYGSESFTLSQGEEWNVLFSYNHGLFLWYPVVVPMLAVGLWQRKSRNWGWIALGSVALVTVVYGSWNPWFLGGAMGARGFVDIVPIISVAGGLGVAQLRPNRRILVLAPAAVLSWATVELMAGYWTGVLPVTNNTAAQFWAQVVGSHAMLHS